MSGGKVWEKFTSENSPPKYKGDEWSLVLNWKTLPTWAETILCKILHISTIVLFFAKRWANANASGRQVRNKSKLHLRSQCPENLNAVNGDDTKATTKAKENPRESCGKGSSFLTTVAKCWLSGDMLDLQMNQDEMIFCCELASTQIGIDWSKNQTKKEEKNRKQRGNKKTGTQLTGSARRRADTTRKKQENSEVTPGWKQTSWRTRQREKHRLNTERVVNKWNTGEQEK